MTILDANLLLYAYNADAPQQKAAAKWLTELVASGEAIGLPWITAWAFIRISTNPRIWNNPLPVSAAFQIVEEWLAQPTVMPLGPGLRHWDLLKDVVMQHKAAGPLFTDAILAAHALENGAALASTDQDFSRFKRVRWVNPLEQ